MSADVAAPDQGPCVGCGMCCDGTIHSRTTLSSIEQESLAARGFELVPWDGKQFLPQPCPMSNCGSCTIYAERFDVCRSFRCSLLKSFEADEISGHEAAEKVATARQLLAAVIADDPQSAQLTHRAQSERDYASAFTAADAADRQAIGARLLRIKALNIYLERWFTNDKHARSPQTPTEVPVNTSAGVAE